MKLLRRRPHAAGVPASGRSSRLVRPLHEAGIPSMVTGALAAIIYGEPRLTNHVDLIVPVEPSDAHAQVFLRRHAARREGCPGRDPGFDGRSLRRSRGGRTHCAEVQLPPALAVPMLTTRSPRCLHGRPLRRFGSTFFGSRNEVQYVRPVRRHRGVLRREVVARAAPFAAIADAPGPRPGARASGRDPQV